MIRIECLQGMTGEYSSILQYFSLKYAFKFQQHVMTINVIRVMIIADATDIHKTISSFNVAMLQQGLLS